MSENLRETMRGLGFVKKTPVCANCIHFRVDVVGMPGQHKRVRTCTNSNIFVRTDSTCNNHTPKGSQP